MNDRTYLHFLPIQSFMMFCIIALFSMLSLEASADDVFSYKHANDLTITAEYDNAFNTLTLDIHNNTNADIYFWQPCFFCPDNIRMLSDTHSYPPPLGSASILTAKKTVPANASIILSGSVLSGKFDYIDSKSVVIWIYIAGVNGETNRTPYKCKVMIKD